MEVNQTNQVNQEPTGAFKMILCNMFPEKFLEQFQDKFPNKCPEAFPKVPRKCPERFLADFFAQTFPAGLCRLEFSGWIFVSDLLAWLHQIGWGTQAGKLAP